MTLNLLAWREQQVKKKFYHDLLMCLILLGVSGLILEIGCGVMGMYEKVLFKRKEIFVQKMADQKTAFEQAKQIEHQYMQQKQEEKALFGIQATWKTFWQALNMLSTEKNSGVQFVELHWEQNAWQIQGYAEKIDWVNEYRTRLESKKYQAVLDFWKPGAEGASSFQLSVMPQAPVA